MNQCYHTVNWTLRRKLGDTRIKIQQFSYKTMNLKMSSANVGHFVWVWIWYTYWRHQVKTFSALLALCGGNSLVTCEFSSQRPVTRSFDIFLDLRLNKRLSKQSKCLWFETPSRSSWRHCNGLDLALICPLSTRIIVIALQWRHWPLRGESIGDRLIWWIPLTKGQQRGICFHLMTSSYMREREWLVAHKWVIRAILHATYHIYVAPGQDELSVVCTPLNGNWVMIARTETVHRY